MQHLYAAIKHIRHKNYTVSEKRIQTFWHLICFGTIRQNKDEITSYWNDVLVFCRKIHKTPKLSPAHNWTTV